MFQVDSLYHLMAALLRKTQNTFSELAVKKKKGDGNFSQRGNYEPNDRELFLDHVSG